MSRFIRYGSPGMFNSDENVHAGVSAAPCLPRASTAQDNDW